MATTVSDIVCHTYGGNDRERVSGSTLFLTSVLTVFTDRLCIYAPGIRLIVTLILAPNLMNRHYCTLLHLSHGKGYN